MKTSVFASLFLAAISACTQEATETNVPAIVRESFTKQFPGAENVKWSEGGQATFEVEFKGATGKQSAEFDSNGNWLITETEIDAKSLPADVLATIEREFGGYEIEEAELVDKRNQGSFYEVELKGDKELEIQFAADGKILKTEDEEGEEDESDEEKD